MSINILEFWMEHNKNILSPRTHQQPNINIVDVSVAAIIINWLQQIDQIFIKKLFSQTESYHYRLRGDVKKHFHNNGLCPYLWGGQGNFVSIVTSLGVFKDKMGGKRKNGRKNHLRGVYFRLGGEGSGLKCQYGQSPLLWKSPLNIICHFDIRDIWYNT